MIVTLTLHMSHVRCFGVMMWWSCSKFISAHLPAEAVAKLPNGLFYCWSLLRNNGHSFKSSKVQFTVVLNVCRVSLLNAILAGNAARQWLLIAIRHVLLHTLWKEVWVNLQQCFTSLKNLLLVWDYVWLMCLSEQLNQTTPMQASFHTV